MTKEQFETRLIASVKPRLAALVDHKVITQAQADKVIDRISKGYVPVLGRPPPRGSHHQPPPPDSFLPLQAGPGARARPFSLTHVWRQRCV